MPWSILGDNVTYNDDHRLLNWTDGTPLPASANNQAGVYIGTNNGFSFTAPADTVGRTLIVHVGGYNSAGTLTAHLSDNSAPDFIDTTATVVRFIRSELHTDLCFRFGGTDPDGYLENDSSDRKWWQRNVECSRDGGWRRKHRRQCRDTAIRAGKYSLRHRAKGHRER